MKTLNQATKQKIKEGIEDFHFYLQETNISIARKIIRESSVLKEVLDYVNNYIVPRETN